MDSVPQVEIERELIRVVRGKLFSKSKKRARLLTYIVKQTLKGKVPTETDLLIDFFEVTDLDVDDPTARVNVARLREKLKEYFATEGLNDLITIEIPKGQYGAVCTYNAQSPAHNEVLIGAYHIDRESPEDIRESLLHFEKAIQLEPSYAEAYAGKAAALISLHNSTEDPRDFLQRAEAAAQAAISLNQHSWRAHAKMGGIYMFKHEWSKCDEEFAIAKSLDAFEVNDDGGYGPYLLCRGKYDAGLDLANSYGREYPTDVIFLQRRALYLYVLRYFDESEKALETVLRRDRHFWISHIQMAFVSLAKKDPNLALKWFESGQKLAGANPWPGLKILCLAAADRMDEAAQEHLVLKAKSENSYIRPMQLGLGCMALGQTEEAITFLEKACKDCEPFTAWLHLWPFLDPLRRFPNFRSLLKRWNYPQD